MSRFTLGPSTQFEETQTTPPPTGPNDAVLRILGVTAGGNVTLQFDPHDNTVNFPINVYVIYVSPPTAAPQAGDPNLTPEWFLSSVFPKVSQSTAQSTQGPFGVTVPGITPGLYLVQTVLEFTQ